MLCTPHPLLEPACPPLVARLTLASRTLPRGAPPQRATRVLQVGWQEASLAVIPEWVLRVWPEQLAEEVVISGSHSDLSKNMTCWTDLDYSVEKVTRLARSRQPGTW